MRILSLLYHFIPPLPLYPSLTILSLLYHFIPPLPLDCVIDGHQFRVFYKSQNISVADADHVIIKMMMEIVDLHMSQSITIFK